MTADECVRAVLIADGWPASEAASWRHIMDTGMLLAVWRKRRSSALERAGMAKTPQSERAGEMVRALLEVASEHVGC